MRVSTVVSADINLAEVYEFCKPTNRAECIKAIRDFASFQLSMMADENGGWQFPSSELIACELIQRGLADPIAG